jgi:CheY-like chemotaxis protein
MKCALVVDDNRALGEDLAEILRDEGYQVLLYDDPLRAAALAPTQAFDVALLDVRMPGLDGVALQRQLARSHTRARFVLMTAYAEDELLAQAQCVQRILLKPVPVQELLAVLREE